MNRKRWLLAAILGLLVLILFALGIDKRASSSGEHTAPPSEIAGALSEKNASRATGEFAAAAASKSLDARSALRGRLLEKGTHAPVSFGTVEISPIDPKTLFARPSADAHPATSSDQEGHFSIADLSPGFYRVTAAAEGRGSSSPVVIRIPYPGELLIELGEQGYIEGIVVDIRGNGAPGAIVRADLSGQSIQATTTQSGSFSLAAPSGAYRVSASNSEASSRVLSPVLVRSGKTTGPLKLVLDSTGHIAGEVVDAKTKLGLAKAQVEVRDPKSALVIAKASTGPDGKFDLGPLPPAIYDVSAGDAAHAPELKKAVVLSSSAQVHLHFALTTLSRVSGRVQDSAARAIAGATVSLRRGVDLIGTGNTGADGSYQIDGLPPGFADAVAARAGTVGGAWKPIDIPAEGLSDLDFTLADDGTLRGHVFAGKGRAPDRPTMVRILPVVSGGAGPEQDLAADPDGAYRGQVAAGAYQLSAAYIDGSGESMRAATRVEAGGTTERDLYIDQDTRPSVQGQVHTESGDPAPFADIRVFDSNGNPLARLQADEQGAFTAYAPVEQSRGLDYLAQYGDMTGAASSAPGASSVDITVHTGATLRGHCVDAQHQPIDGFSLELRTTQASTLPLPDGLHQLELPGSTFEVPSVPRTVLLLLATSGDLAGQQMVDLSGDIVPDIELVLSGSAAIHGIAQDRDTHEPIPGLFVYLDTSVPPGLQGTPADGSFSLENVAPGTHQLSLRNAVYLEQRSIEMGTVDLDLGVVLVAKKKAPSGSIGAYFIQQQDGVYINFLLPDGPADQAGLRIGDQVLSIDGAPVTSAQDAKDRAQGAPSTQVVVEVSRAGVRIVANVQRAP